MHGRERADGRKMLIPMAVAQGGATGPKESPAAALYSSVLLFSSAPPRFTPVARRCRAASPGQKRREGGARLERVRDVGILLFLQGFFLSAAQSSGPTAPFAREPSRERRRGGSAPSCTGKKARAIPRSPPSRWGWLLPG